MAPDEGAVRIEVLQRLAEQAMNDAEFRNAARDDLPGALEEQVSAFVEHYNPRAHESLKNLTPADVYFGRGEAILAERERITKQTLTQRRLQHHARAA